jgi:hypothetical protein
MGPDAPDIKFKNLLSNDNPTDMAQFNALTDHSRRTKARKICHFLSHTITRYPELAYQSKFHGWPILLLLIVPIANHAGFSQTAVILTINPHGLLASENGKNFLRK